MKRKKGFIIIADDFYRHEWEYISRIFHYFRPYRIQFIESENAWYFYGESNLFDEVQECDAMPQYDIIFTNNEDGFSTWKFERVYRGDLSLK